eukprot:5456872-Prymnesium_polylepis.1
MGKRRTLADKPVARPVALERHRPDRREVSPDVVDVGEVGARERDVSLAAVHECATVGASVSVRVPGDLGELGAHGVGLRLHGGRLRGAALEERDFHAVVQLVGLGELSSLVAGHVLLLEKGGCGAAERDDLEIVDGVLEENVLDALGDHARRRLGVGRARAGSAVHPAGHAAPRLHELLRLRLVQLEVAVGVELLKVRHRRVVRHVGGESGGLGLEGVQRGGRSANDEQGVGQHVVGARGAVLRAGCRSVLPK